MCSMLICRGSSRVQHLVLPSILVLTSTYIYSCLYYTKKRRRRKKSQQISFCSCCKHCIFVIMFPEFSTTTICFYVNSRQFTCNKKKLKYHNLTIDDLLIASYPGMLSLARIQRISTLNSNASFLLDRQLKYKI